MRDIEHPEITHAMKTGYATYEEFLHDDLQDEEGCRVCGDVSEEEVMFDGVCNDCSSNLNMEDVEDDI